MRPPSSRLFPNLVLFQTASPVPDSSGDTGRTVLSTGTALAANVEAQGDQRSVVHGGVESLVSHIVSFPAPPVDTSAGARAGNPACRVMDRFTWNPIIGGVVVLYALGPALDDVGRSVFWIVNCEARG